MLFLAAEQQSKSSKQYAFFSENRRTKVRPLLCEKNRAVEGVIMLHKKVLKVELHLKYFCEYLDFWRKGSIMFRCIGMYGNNASPHNSNYVVPGM